MLTLAELFEKLNSMPSFEILGGSLILLSVLTYFVRSYHYDRSRVWDIGTSACEFLVGLIFLLHPLKTENNIFIFGLIILIGLLGVLSVEVIFLRQKLNSLKSKLTE